MYGLPSDTDVSFIARQRLIQACFGQNDLILKFDENGYVSILVMSAIGCIPSTGVCRRVADFREAANFVLGLLGVLVSSVQVIAEGTLSITFESGERLEIYDDRRQFESYTIEHSGKTIVV
jgi:hypothetical protein